MKTLKLRLRAALLLGGLLTGSLAQATTFVPLTLAQQAKKADVIVQATIGIPTTLTEGTQVYAVYPLKVSETLAGDAATLPQTVGSQGGGGPALFVLSGVETAPVFQAGQEVVLLLYRGRLDSPLVGYNQGAYLVSNGQVSVLSPPLLGTQGAGAVPGQPLTQIPAYSAASQPAGTPAPLAPAAPLPAVSVTPVGVPVSAPVPPIPVLTTVPTSETQVVAPTVPATATPAAAAPPTAPPGSAPPVPGAVPAAALAGQGDPSPAVILPAGVVAVGVLGTIRTSAELKAAIVAARAVK